MRSDRTRYSTRSPASRCCASARHGRGDGRRRRVVVAARAEQLEAALRARVAIAVQDQQKGTGHAVQTAEAALRGFGGAVLILYGDTPFVTQDTLSEMLERLGRTRPWRGGPRRSPEDGKTYGRVILGDGDRIAKMVEIRSQRGRARGRLCNSGMMAVHSGDLFRRLGQVGNANAGTNTTFPTSSWSPMAKAAMPVATEGEVRDRRHQQPRRAGPGRTRLAAAPPRARRWSEGATLIAPESVWFSADTELGRDCTIEPNVVFGPGVNIADGATIHAFSHIEGATIATRRRSALLRGCGPARSEKAPRSAISSRSRRRRLGKGAKVNHLTYIGDAEVGAGANIGAGTITCNYDGYFKHRTEIGEGAFIGSNSSLVAPVKIGAGAIVGAGSVVTKNVPADLLAVARGEQRGFVGWAKALPRGRQAAKKDSDLSFKHYAS